MNKIVASVVIYRIKDMTKKGRKNICNWLRRLAMDVEKHPDSFAKMFKARYLYGK